MTFSKKNVIVISGHSGVGKSTLIKHVLEKFNTVQLSVSCTTRLARSGEQDGRDYYFITSEKFSDLVANGEFIEYTECFGNYYGTLKSEINRILDNGCTCILDIEFKGARNVLVNKILGNDINCTGILIETSHRNDLKTRLIARGENELNISNRINNHDVPNDIKEMYNYKILNDILENAKIDIVKVFEQILTHNY